MGLCFAIGCAASDGDLAGEEYMDEDLPPWSCGTSGPTGTGPCESSGGPAPDCVDSAQCMGEVCAASFDGEIGPFECQSSCIEPMDDQRWCSDAAACCDADAICDRGYCVVVAGLETGTETSSATESSSDASTGTDSGSDSGTTQTGTDSGSTGTTGGTDGA